MAARRRLDAELVRRGLVVSRAEAKVAVEAGLVVVSGSMASKPTRLVDPAESIGVLAPPARYVGRGGEKLEAALEAFSLSVVGKRCLDVGASTGGFTDCLLQHGATEVTALDVGHGQIHRRLRDDPRVIVIERRNIRTVVPGDLGPLFDVVVADLSFISLRLVAEPIAGLGRSGADLVLLVKPQFEAGRREVSRGRGVITDPDVWRGALSGAVDAVVDTGAAVHDIIASPLRGAEGNVEFLLHAKAGTDASATGAPVSSGDLVDRAVASATPAHAPDQQVV